MKSGLKRKTGICNGSPRVSTTSTKYMKGLQIKCRKFVADMVSQQLKNGMVTEIEKILEDEKVKILWDCRLQTDKFVEHPDIVLMLREK